MSDEILHARIDELEARVQHLERISGATELPILDYKIRVVAEGVTSYGYARQQVWNADMSMLHFTRGKYGIYDGNGRRIADSPVSSNYAWDLKSNDRIYGIRGDAFVGIVGLPKNHSMLHSLRGNYVFGGESGMSVSQSFVLEERDKIILVDARMDEKLSISKLANHDWSSISPSGKYVLVRSGRSLMCHPVQGEPYEITDYCEHGDMVQDDDGVDWWVQMGRTVWACPIYDTSGRYDISDWNAYLHGHICGKAYGVPGLYCYSTNQEIGTLRIGDGWDDRTVWVEAITSGAEYLRDHQASISPDGRQIIYRTDHGNVGSKIQTCIVEQTEQWL